MAHSSTCLDASKKWLFTGIYSINRVSEWLWLENQEAPQNGQNVHGFPVRTPICHIVPISRAYLYILHPDKPRPSHPRELDFGPFRLSVRFGSVWLRFGSVSGLFRVRFGSVFFGMLGGVRGWVGVESGRGASVREKKITNLHPHRNDMIILLGYSR